MKDMNEKVLQIPKQHLDPFFNQTRVAWAVRVGIFLLSCFLASVILVAQRQWGMGIHEFAIGEPAPRTFFSPYELSYVDEKETAELRTAASQTILPVFVLSQEANQVVQKKNEDIFNLLSQIKAQGENERDPRWAQLPIPISRDDRRWLLSRRHLEETQAYVQSYLGQSASQLILPGEKKQELLTAGISQITLLIPDLKIEKNIPLRDISTLQDIKDQVGKKIRDLKVRDQSLKDNTLLFWNALIAPNLILDEQETKIRREKVSSEIPEVEEAIQENELIVQRGMLVTPYTKQRLDLVFKESAKQEALSKFLAVSLFVFLTYLLGFIYLYYFEKKVLRSYRNLFLIHLVLLMTLLICKVIASWPAASIYLMPTALASLLLTLLLSPRVGFLIGGMVSILIAPLVEFNAGIVIGSLFSCAAGIFASYRISKRLQFIKVGLVIGVVYFLTLFAFRIFQEYSIEQAFLVALQGFASGLLITTPLAFLLLPILEWAFNSITDITLLELSDLNHPLLKRMILEAPGTYHHSLVVSALSESACQAIGANPLLARVGAYFHDIGKMARSEYFIENKSPQAASKHEKLTPTMSCLLIMNHVKDGMELGRRYKLKEQILRFIPEHQGTGVIVYFYKKACDMAKPDEFIDMNDYRYPGPKPQTRETAVVMLADSTEAASRSLREPTAENIRQLVRKIINDKFVDGQLDECSLTLRDLHKIQESFVHNLMAIFHTRVTYPTMPVDPNRPDIFSSIAAGHAPKKV